MNSKTRKDISDIADYYRKTKTSQRLNLIISVLYNFLILIFIIGTIITVIKSGTFLTIFGEKQDFTRRFNCESGEIKDTVKTYEDAKYFINMYGGYCKLTFEDGND